MLAPALLAALRVATAAAEPLDVAGTPVVLGLTVRSGGHELSLPLSWRSEAGARVGAASSPELEAELRLAVAPGGATRLTATLRWRRAAGLERAAVTLGWSGREPWAVGRELVVSPLTAPIRTGRGTPLVAGAGGLLLVGGPGLVAARLEPRQGGPGLAATLFLDDAAERPFATYLDCLPHLPRLDQGGAAYAALEKKQAWRETPRAPGAVDRLEVTLQPVGEGTARPLVVERWPAGARAAVVFTDHADRTDAGALRAVLFGHSDPRAEGSRGAGLLGRGLAITRTFFAWPGPGTLEDPETARLGAWLVGLGSEVGLHSISEQRDTPEEVVAGLAATAQFGPRTWIDHEPYVNCEAISAQGGRDSGPWAIRDPLAAGGIRWLWAAGDVAGFRRVELTDLFAVGGPGEPSPVLYPFPGDPRFWVFQTSFFYAPPAELAHALSDEALEALERRRGLFVGHTYLGPGPATTPRGLAWSRLPVRRALGGGLVVDPDLDEAFARLATRVRAGRLASLNWDETGTRLRALGEVEVRYLADGGAEVMNHGTTGLTALTVTLPAAGLELWIDGAPLTARQEEAGQTRAWFDLPAGGTRRLTVTRGLEPVPLLPPAPPVR